MNLNIDHSSNNLSNGASKMDWCPSVGTNWRKNKLKPVKEKKIYLNKNFTRLIPQNILR
jgi:hypothetical protein